MPEHRTPVPAVPPAPAEPAGIPVHRRRALAMVVLIVASFMDLLDTTIVNVGLPAIQKDIHATPGHLEWVVGGYTLAFAVVLITGGRLGDIVGRRTVFLTGVAGFTLASLGASLAHNGDTLVAARVVQGAFAALMVPQVLASVQALYKPRERAAVLGIIGAVSGLAAVAGPLLGGWLVSVDAFSIGWRSIFVINLPIGLALLAAAWRLVPDTRSAHPLRLDIPGLLLASAGLFLLVFPLVEGREAGWPGWIRAMLAASPLVLAAFVVNQRRRMRRDGSPLAPMHLFADRGFTSGSIVQLCFSGAMAGFFLILALYLQIGLHFSAIASGLTLLPFTAGAFLGSAASVPLAPRAGKPLVIAGALMQTGGILWARHVIDAQGAGLSGWDLLWPLALAGLGLGFLVVPLVDLALATVDVRDAGAASGVYSTFQQFGAALGVAVTGVVFFGRTHDGYEPSVMKTALLVGALVCAAGYLLAAVAGLFLPASRLAQHEIPQEEDEETAAAVQPAAH
ncbi:EmrB/QacA subfamily drug resistance transporter [Streptomyces sp. 1114.5]|uniref:MFS transporter n=1 Tax=Streptomyces sp. 1114.5 TaxID=1938830 RepID=UPI000EAF6EBB|nr:MFS transporter [Streptomyces sp. 1114.5]RKT09485.1 EmrB/QacA subfamily drug resistance transporter [Streptomyces sp. 1114.5]